MCRAVNELTYAKFGSKNRVLQPRAHSGARGAQKLLGLPRARCPLLAVFTNGTTRWTQPKIDSG